MQASQRLSRRDMMKLAGAVGGLAMSGAPTSVYAQAGGKIESMAPELANI